MKVKFPNALLIIDILTAVLVTSIFYYPSSFVNIILGIPILLLFPGYALLQALFVGNERKSTIELVALSIVISVAIVALIGFGLNYTTWGITLEPVLICISGFIYLMSAIALIRRAVSKRIRLITEFNFNIPYWEGSGLNKAFSVVLVVLILCAGGVLGYVINANKTAEIFTEFYVLGPNGEAQDYPSEFIMEDGQVAYVRYGNGAYQIDDEWGEVTLGIVSHEKQEVTYRIRVTVNDESANIKYNGEVVKELLLTELQPGETWEQVIGFTPQNIGDNQKVEFLFFKDDDTEYVNSLQLWINACEELADFYLLGPDGQSQDYPSEFVIKEGKVARVIYGDGAYQIASEWGEVTLGIVNHERQEVTYTVTITVNDGLTNIHYNGRLYDELELVVGPSSQLESVIGFAPAYVRDDQEVEIVLFKEDDITPINIFQLFIDVR